ncbi:hypothetical protein LTR59_001572 [Friedmanniomyces endolithicus]|nr:hypothetical protein LTR94_010840 [Friedmanniomyces endolithicus]KAK0812096.1 hypothetical protein LTR59_001572 [Friedmanniomyces endolithicus]KAK0819324.1 hypothetical protein LTR38_000767 [Friedmanniomyces endolithicus]KAK0821845.1 hypothetical protein LTR75_000502 [Friedmanniomyces endolithicus]
MLGTIYETAGTIPATIKTRYRKTTTAVFEKVKALFKKTDTTLHESSTPDLNIRRTQDSAENERTGEQSFKLASTTAPSKRADDHHGHIRTLVFNRVYAQKAEMSMLDHFAPAGPYKDGGVTAPHAPAPDVNVKKTSGGDNQLDGEEMKERSMMWE